MGYDHQAAVQRDLEESIHRYARTMYPGSRDMGNFEYLVDVLARTMIPATIAGFTKLFENYQADLYKLATTPAKVYITEEELVRFNADWVKRDQGTSDGAIGPSPEQPPSTS